MLRQLCVPRDAPFSGFVAALMCGRVTLAARRRSTLFGEVPNAERNETYDRPSATFLAVQTDIAEAVTKALTASIDSGEHLSQSRAHEGFQFSN
jgi:hypothetical protein